MFICTDVHFTILATVLPLADVDKGDVSPLAVFLQFCKCIPLLLTFFKQEIVEALKC
jgi:hypothetical protein